MKKMLAFLAASLAAVTLAAAASATTLYAPDGRTIWVEDQQAPTWINVGWSRGVTIYAPDGRTAEVSPYVVNDYLAVGWYAFPVATIYDASGNGVVVAKNEVQTYVNLGWYASLEDAKTTIYAPGDRTARVFRAEVPAYVAVGWSETPVVSADAYVQKIKADSILFGGSRVTLYDAFDKNISFGFIFSDSSDVIIYFYTLISDGLTAYIIWDPSDPYAEGAWLITATENGTECGVAARFRPALYNRSTKFTYEETYNMEPVGNEDAMFASILQLLNVRLGIEYGFGVRDLGFLSYDG